MTKLWYIAVAYGNHMGVLSFIWKVSSVDKVDQTKVARIVTKLSKNLK